ncbi:Enoyl-CoA hydratase [Oceanicaulis sp. 350]|uniref:enoyl-CoA hydratase-related protein n=1 Tax=Oceanicaulis alexandrii TaxID=153233 RepID=UPI0012EF98C2|nr:enoyl-CoA hydratase-related protein [Oceanicaulis alexandrii]VXC78363.1 Enoyl-CoA hydratase [Oceanicaulis sp. 350]
MSYSTIRYDVQDGISLLTLHRPDAMNAFTTQMGEEMADAFDRSDADPAVRAMVVTGEGRAFCAGADLSLGAETFNAVATAQAEGELVDTDPQWRDFGGRLNLRIFDSEKPVVAAINGASVGIGATMILPMDARVALAGAKFALPFTKRGIAWDGCASWFLPRLVGVEAALDWGLSGRTFLAEEALARGLVSELQDTPEAVLERALERARLFVKDTAPVSVAMNRRLLWRMLGASHPMEAHRLESRAILHRGMSPDAAEGVTSFLEKRTPNFPGQVPADYPAGWPWDTDPQY